MGTGGLTRSGRCYASGLAGVKEGEESIERSDVEVTVPKKKGKEPLNEPVSESEANDFLSSLSTVSIASSSSYINCQLRFLCCH